MAEPPQTAPRIRGYIAASLDGFIATPDGGVEWLAPYQEVEAGYGAFIAEIGTVVLGRTTFEQAMGFGIGWPYPGKRGIVVTSRPLHDPPEDVAAWNGGIPGLAGALRRGGQDGAWAGDAWIVGGAGLQQAFMDIGAIDRLDLFIVPELLGEGIPLFPRSARRHRLRLEGTAALPMGMVRLTYGPVPD
ncbi:dihydrofolate reductase family protein [Arenibaculum pallidiluteum]|uniref:dihydrofolate reductase family protein n=1 Tax=Arenibaculum pallidiluteum TaxID=2812559 RepID=UPI001A965647|nr:dihydrofolate reductase family protein [Arenibaculum pallidiluteum]